LLALISLPIVISGCASSAPNAIDVTPTPSGTHDEEPATTEAIVNNWVDPGAVTTDVIPIGDGAFSTVAPAVGSVFSCTAANPSAPGAQAEGPWITGDTWSLTDKLSVQGEISWPTASFDVRVDGDFRVITTNNLPVDDTTGTFPIANSDPARAYDRNPNSISDALQFTWSLPVTPTPSSTPHCLGLGAVGVLLNGVILFSAVDARGDDAVAHELQDACQGHPEQSDAYHHHSVSLCVTDTATGPSTVVGWSLDGYPIVVERDEQGILPTNADLDECHGRTSPILLDGEIVETYHYSATLEYPYTIGCFRAPTAG
jgi:YHYH protein